MVPRKFAGIDRRRRLPLPELQAATPGLRRHEQDSKVQLKVAMTCDCERLGFTIGFASMPVREVRL
jgi:hypothetical protein